VANLKEATRRQRNPAKSLGGFLGTGFGGGGGKKPHLFVQGKSKKTTRGGTKVKKKGPGLIIKVESNGGAGLILAMLCEGEHWKEPIAKEKRGGGKRLGGLAWENGDHEKIKRPNLKKKKKGKS